MNTINTRWIVILDVPRTGNLRANVIGAYRDDAAGRAAAAETARTEGSITVRMRGADLVEAVQAATAAEGLKRRNAMAPKGSTPDRDLTVSEAAKHYDCASSVVRRAISLGRLVARRAGPVWIIPAAEVPLWSPSKVGWPKGRRRSPRA